MSRKLLLLPFVLAFVIIFCAAEVFAIPVDLSKFDLRDDNDISFWGSHYSSAQIKEDINGDAPEYSSTLIFMVKKYP